jgi:hypothetical protein
MITVRLQDESIVIFENGVPCACWGWEEARIVAEDIIDLLDKLDASWAGRREDPHA